MQKGDFVTAGNIAKKGLVSNPNNPYLLQSVINANSSQGNQTGTETNSLEQSKPYIDQALQTDGKSVDTLIAIGYAYETAGDYTTALDYYNKAIAVDPNSSAAYFHKGHVLAFLNRTVESQAAYDKAYALDPKDGLVLLEKGTMNLANNKRQDAYDTFTQITQTTAIDNNTKSEAFMDLAVMLQQDGKFAESLKKSTSSVELNPNYAVAYGIHGFNLIINGKPKEGIYAIAKGTQINPRVSRNYYMIAEVLRLGKNYSGALINYQKAIQKVPNDNTLVGEQVKGLAESKYLYNLAINYVQMGNQDEAINSLKNAISKNPSLKSQLQVDSGSGKEFSQLNANPKFALLLQN